MLIEDGRIAAYDVQPNGRNEDVIDARGLIVCPGLIDMHVHLREPGNEEDETIATGTAAAAGRRLHLGRLHAQHRAADRHARRRPSSSSIQAARAGKCNVYRRGAASARTAKGKELAELGQLVAGGAVAFTDDGAPVVDAELMRRAFEYCRDVRQADHAALPGPRADRTAA